MSTYNFFFFVLLHKTFILTGTLAVRPFPRFEYSMSPELANTESAGANANDDAAEKSSPVFKFNFRGPPPPPAGADDHFKAQSEGPTVPSPNPSTDADAGDQYRPGKDQLLRFEFASPTEVRTLMVAVDLCLLSSIALVILWAVLKKRETEGSPPSRALSLLNLVFSCVTLAASSALIFFLGHDLSRAFRARLRWTRRRWLLFVYAAVEYLVSWLMVALSVPSYAVVYSNPCAGTSDYFVIVVSAIRSVLLSIHLLLMGVSSRNSNLRPDLARKLGIRDAINLDGPQWQNLPFTIGPFLLSLGSTIAVLVKWVQVQHQLSIACRFGYGADLVRICNDQGGAQGAGKTVAVLGGLRWAGLVLQIFVVIIFTHRASCGTVG